MSIIKIISRERSDKVEEKIETQGIDFASLSQGEIGRIRDAEKDLDDRYYLIAFKK